MSSEKVLVIVEMDGTFLGVTAGDFVDVRVINWAAIREEGGLWCPECGHEWAEPDTTTASDVWTCVQCKATFERHPQSAEADDGPGPEYIEAFNAHIEALKAPPAIPFTTRGFGKLPTRLEMIRLQSFVEKSMHNSNGGPIVCEYQVGYDVGIAVQNGYKDDDNPYSCNEDYHQSWRSAVRKWQQLFTKYGALEGAEIWIYLDIFEVDDDQAKFHQVANVCLLSLYQGEVGLYYNHMRGLVEPPQP